MNVAIEMHDSELLSVEIDDAGRGSVLLGAFVHRSVGKPGVSPGDGGVQLVRITMDQMAIEGGVGELPAYVYQGSLLVGDTLQDNMVPFQPNTRLSFASKMMLSEDARVITVSGKGAAIESEGEFEYVEDFDGANLPPSNSQ